MGSSTSGYTLGYDGPSQRWTFAMSREDRPDGVGSMSVARSTQVPQSSVWTHLAGSYDHDKHEMKLYVDGELVAVTPQHMVWDAAGPLVLGRGKLEARPSAG